MTFRLGLLATIGLSVTLAGCTSLYEQKFDTPGNNSCKLVWSTYNSGRHSSLLSSARVEFRDAAGKEIKSIDYPGPETRKTGEPAVKEWAKGVCANAGMPVTPPPAPKIISGGLGDAGTTGAAIGVAIIGGLIGGGSTTTTTSTTTTD